MINELQKKQQMALKNVVKRISDSEKKTAATRIGELNCLHIAASMDVKKTTNCLEEILIYKQEAAREMLKCSDDEQMIEIANIIKHADDLIKKVLGINGI
jgi:hypothetical protein